MRDVVIAAAMVVGALAAVGILGVLLEKMAVHP